MLVSLAGGVLVATAVAEGADPTPTRSPRGATDSAQPGTVAASISGPAAITIDPSRVPDRVFYPISLVYHGPPITTPDVQTVWTVRASPHFNTPGADQLLEGNNFDCTASPPPAPAISCTAAFTEARRTTRVLVGMRPNGTAGTATITLEVATGATATWTTDITRASSPPPPPPPPPPAPPAPIPGPPAAPTRSMTETFTEPGETETESVQVAPTAETVQVALTWPDADSTFDVAGVRLLAPARSLSLYDPAARSRLRITKRRTPRSLDVRIKNVTRGRLVFKVVAKRLDGRTRVRATIRQSKR